MSQATICIPSNRKLVDAVEPLWSAITYGQATGMKVVISDNSRDDDKKDYFSSTPDHVTYISEAPEFPADNLLSALSHAEGDFVLMLGDDDVITLADGAQAPDFAALPDDVIGIKPRIEIWSPKLGLTAVNDFTIDADNAAARVIEYTRKMQGGNSSYYSFFRTAEFRPIIELYRAHHPTHIGNVDFALVYALIANGRLLHDAGTTIRYNNERWDDWEHASAAFDDIFRAAQMPAETRAYMLLFHFLDSYVLMFRKDSQLAPIERYKAGYAVSMVFLKRLLFRIGQQPSSYGLVADLVELLTTAVESGDPDLDKIFHIAGLMADRLKPGLKGRYDQYLLVSARGV